MQARGPSPRCSRVMWLTESCPWDHPRGLCKAYELLRTEAEHRSARMHLAFTSQYRTCNKDAVDYGFVILLSVCTPRGL